MALVVVLGVWSAGDYAVRTLRGQTSPNRATWFLWGFAPLVMFVAQRSTHVGLESIYTLVLSVGPLLVVAASFLNRTAVWKLTLFDWACGAVALVALLIWLVTQEGLLGFGLALAADVLAGIPNLYKGFRHPGTEHSRTYILSGLAALITIAASQQHTFMSIGLPLWVVVNASCMIYFIHRTSA